MKLTEYLNLERGRFTSLAKSIGAHAPDVCRWAKEKSDKDYRPVPIIKCYAIELATSGQVSRKDLRPDDWVDIWPELIKKVKK